MSALGGLARQAFTSVTSTATTFATQSGASYILPIMAGFVGLALIIFIVFIAIQLRAHRPAKVTTGPLDLFSPKTPVVVDRNTTRSVMKGTYSLSFYIRIDAVPDMRATATPLLTWPGIWDMGYSPAHETMRIIFQQTPDKQNESISPNLVELKAIPLQRWNQVMITFEGRTTDLYVNGQLVTSTTLRNVPPVGNASITLVPEGMMGQIAYIQVWSRRLIVSEVESNYIDTSDSQGRPFLGPDFLKTISNLSVPNLFCPSGNCAGTSPSAKPSQKWEFPYA
jgi:hypothetical protein